MNQISKELRREIENNHFMNEVVGELQERINEACKNDTSHVKRLSEND